MKMVGDITATSSRLTGALLVALVLIPSGLWAQGSQDPKNYKLEQPKALRGDQSAWRLKWSYFPEGDELEDAVWSPTGKRMAIVRQVHWPDGGDAYNYNRWQLSMLSERQAVDPRFADPVVFLISERGTKSEKIGYGRAPSFSPDGRYLAYAEQMNPQTGLRRFVAATGAGNPVVVVDLKTKTREVWGKPEEGHQFSNPIWVDKKTILASDCWADNGQLLGCPGAVKIHQDKRVIKLSLSDKRRKERIPRAKSGVYLWSAEGDAAVLNQYAPKTTRRVAELKGGFESYVSINANWSSPSRLHDKRALMILDGHWHSIDFKTGRHRKHGPAPIGKDTYEASVFASPKSRYVLYSLAPQPLIDGIYLAKALSKKGVRIWSGPGNLEHAVWSADGKRVALIVSRHGSGDPETRFAGNELLVYAFPKRPTGKSVPPYKWQSDWR